MYPYDILDILLAFYIMKLLDNIEKNIDVSVYNLNFLSKFTLQKLSWRFFY